jgi:NTP pyrophosphatase (non-canonical NTP hydrolase)
LVEEVGEVARAYLQRTPREKLAQEAAQVACVAIRIIEEGDSSFDSITDEESKP